jgi:hypothetical protein
MAWQEEEGNSWAAKVGLRGFNEAGWDLCHNVITLEFVTNWRT